MVTSAQATPFVPILTAAYAERRSRLTVAFRIILVIPHLLLLYAGGILATFAAIFGWFAALVLGRLPEPIARFLGRFLLYYTRVVAYASLLTDTYPPFKFEEAEYPVSIEVRPGRLNRLAVLFRLILVLPVSLLNGLAYGGWVISSFFIWLIILITGRMPRALFDAGVAILRFFMRVSAYSYLLSSAYPSGLFGDPPAGVAAPMPPDRPPPSEIPAPPEAPPPSMPASEVGAPVVTERPPDRLVLSSPAKRLVGLFIALGVLYWILIAVAPWVGSGGILQPLRARNSFFSANQSFGTRVQTFQQAVGQCDTQPEPFRCAQDAERALVDALARFDAAVARVDFPGEVNSEVLRVKAASSSFRSAIETLIGADSEEEYFQLVQRLDQTGTEFDAAVLALGTALDRLVTSR